MSVASAQPFPADALETNRAGQLSPNQLKLLSGTAKADRKNEFTGAFICVVLGLLILFGVDSSKPAYLHYGFPVVAFLAAGYFLYRSTSAGDALTKDLHSVRVESVEGAVRKWVVNSHDSGNGGYTSTSHFVEVEHERFRIGSTEYSAIPEAGWVRIYYLPKSRTVVNFEHLADRPLPEGALEAPMDTLKMAMAGMHSHDSVQQAEAMATLQALGNAEKAAFKPVTATPPPADQRDPRPLAEAILGTWQLGPMKVQFQNDGTASMTAMMGKPREGHWSVDSNGNLHVDALGGRDQATEAWVAGDSLTISVDGQAMTAHRVVS